MTSGTTVITGTMALRVLQRVVFPGDDLDVVPLYVETNLDRGASELASEQLTEALVDSTTVAGVAGVPWFAGHASGYVGASFGYILGYAFAAALCGYLASRGADRSVLGSVPAMLAGEVVIYAFGMTWLALYLHLGLAATISEGLTPFIIGDAIKTAIAAGLLPAAWKLAGRRPSGSDPSAPAG